jgi:nucleotide-binding universal stress UspA family protein
MRKNTILVPIDFSEVADTAIRLAAEFAKQHNGDLSLLHVIEKRVTVVGRNRKFDNELIEEATYSRLETYADQIENTHKVKTDILAIAGNIFDTINDVAKEINANWVFMGTHGVKGFNLFGGSSALKVVYHSAVPYILTQRSMPNGFNFEKIVIPIDYRLQSREVATWAIHCYKKFGSKAYLITPTASDSGIAKKIAGNLTYVKDKLLKAGMEFHVDVSERQMDDLAVMTNDYAKFVKANLIMVMVFPATGVEEFLFSNAAQKIIANPGEIPVFCINPSTLYEHQIED